MIQISAINTLVAAVIFAGLKFSISIIHANLVAAVEFAKPLFACQFPCRSLPAGLKEKASNLKTGNFDMPGSFLMTMKAPLAICTCLWFALLPLTGQPQAEPDAMPTASALISEDESAEWIDLFEGNNFSKWIRTDGSEVSSAWLGGWRIDGGVVERHGLLAGDIVTKKVYGDFELKFEWKISKKGNSGVIYRQKEGKGLEYQILDDKRHSDGKLPSHRAASLYDLAAAPEKKPLKPVGMWNQARIVVRGLVIEHWLNGERVVHLEMQSGEWAQRVAESKFAGLVNFGRKASPVLLQDHLDKVWFRNVWIREISQ